MASVGRTKKIALCALFVSLHIVGGFVRIPTPFAPITLQLQLALLAGILLGAEWGGVSVLLYLLLGLIGLPVFASGGGVSYVLQPTFGYLLGFALSAFVAGKIVRMGILTRGKIVCAFLIGLLISYALGLIYAACIFTLYLHQSISIWDFLLGYFLLTLPKDLALAAIGVPLVKRFAGYMV